MEIDRLSSLDYVEVTYQGQNYPAPPDIVVIDGFTKEVLGDVDLEMVLGEDRLKIIQNNKRVLQKRINTNLILHTHHLRRPVI